MTNIIGLNVPEDERQAHWYSMRNFRSSRKVNWDTNDAWDTYVKTRDEASYQRFLTAYITTEHRAA